jgi:outer membrane protein assembly factor BamD
LKYIVFALIALLLISCSGTKDRKKWGPKEFFREAMEKYNDESYFEAVTDFSAILLRFSGSTIADSAQYFLGMSHYNMDEFILAAAEFERLVNAMNQSPLVPQAQYMLAQSYNDLSPRAALDQEYTLRAIREYQNFVEEFPSDSQKDKAEENIIHLRGKLSEKEYENAEIYRKMKEFKAALIYYDEVLSKYYDSKWADDALMGKIKTYIEMEDYDAALLEVAKFEQQFPKSLLVEETESLKLEIIEKQNELAKE